MKTQICLSAIPFEKVPSSLGIRAVARPKTTRSACGSDTKPLDLKTLVIMCIVKTVKAGRRAILRGRKRTRQDWKQAPNKSHVVIRKLSRKKLISNQRIVKGIDRVEFEGIVATCWSDSKDARSFVQTAHKGPRSES